MSDKTDETYAALQKAAAWFTTLQASDASGNDHARWERWMAAAPAHRTAWRKIEALNVAPPRRVAVQSYCGWPAPSRRAHWR